MHIAHKLGPAHQDITKGQKATRKGTGGRHEGYEGCKMAEGQEKKTKRLTQGRSATSWQVDIHNKRSNKRIKREPQTT